MVHVCLIYYKKFRPFFHWQVSTFSDMTRQMHCIIRPQGNFPHLSNFKISAVLFVRLFKMVCSTFFIPMMCSTFLRLWVQPFSDNNVFNLSLQMVCSNFFTYDVFRLFSPMMVSTVFFNDMLNVFYLCTYAVFNLFC